MYSVLHVQVNGMRNKVIHSADLSFDEEYMETKFGLMIKFVKNVGDAVKDIQLFSGSVNALTTAHSALKNVSQIYSALDCNFIIIN